MDIEYFLFKSTSFKFYARLIFCRISLLLPLSLLLLLLLLLFNDAGSSSASGDRMTTVHCLGKDVEGSGHA
jgi:hypothetical protein